MINETLPSLLKAIQKKYVVEFDLLAIDGQNFEVLTIQNMKQLLSAMVAKNAIHNPLKDLPLWSKIWPGSFVLGRFLRKFSCQDKALLELGGGCGIVSLAASKYGFASIVCTDINEDALLFAKANVLKNNLQHLVEVKFLDVHAPTPTHADLPKFDCIAASELLYLEELHRPLIRFLELHLKADGVALFCTDRARHKPHFAKLAKKTFSLQEGHIGIKSTDDAGKEERRIFDIYVVRHK
ncbi:MAG: 50S ribosomal protein L11 methyltransferase [Desulfovibrio sp.]|nr:50S ribosomal protein L11 methyltransferase [Desulfovibrio sp.]